MAQCYFMIQKYEEAVHYAEIVLQQFSGSYLEKDLRLLLGENYFLKGDYDEAVKNLMIMEKYPEYGHFDYVYYLLGRVYYDRFLYEERDKSKNASESVRFFDRVINEFPDSIITPHAEFRKANVLYGRGEYKKALEAALGVKNKGVSERFSLMTDYFIAWNRFMLGEYTKAVEIYDGIIQKYPGDILAVWSRYKKGICFEEQGREADALKIYGAVAENYPDSIPAAYSIYASGMHLYKKGEYYPALERFDRVLSGYNIEDLHRACVFMKADIYGKLNKHYLAKREFEIIERNYPDDRNTARYMQGWSYFKEGDFNEAKEIFEELIKDESADEETAMKSVLKLGDTYYELKMYEEAKKEYAKVIGAFRKFPELAFEATYGHGWVNYSLNNMQKAKDDFYTARRRAVDAEQRLRSDFMRANTLYTLYDFKGALEIYLGIISTREAGKGIRREAYFYAGWCYYRLERFSLAVSFWEKYMAEAENRVKRAEAVYRIGWAYFRENKFGEAEKKFAEITEKYKDTHFYQEALLKKGDSLYNKGDYAPAAEAYGEIVEKFPDHYRVPEALYGIQWSYYQLGENEKAIELSREFLKKYRGSSFAPEIQYRVAEHYYNDGKKETALEEYKKFLEENPNHALTSNALYWSG
ncbi:MAG TPA: tetratricopeptide repeat protein, partial [Firmicutes bacterium]|nr:tetratricopeptide repeat protein [Bacillota bacterium]